MGREKSTPSMAQSSFAHMLQSFSGSQNENINFFISQFEEIASLEAWSNEKKFVLLKLHLKNDAQDFLINDPTASSAKNFAELAKALKDKFAVSTSFHERQQKFSAIRQRQGQSVSQLAEQVKSAAHKFFGSDAADSERFTNLKLNMMQQKFLDALRPDIKSEVLKFGSATFEETVQCAKNIETAIMGVEGDESAGMHTTSTLNLNNILEERLNTHKLISDLQSRINVLEQQNAALMSSNQNRGNNAYICHICGKNHITTRCWQYPGAQPDNSTQNNRYTNRVSPYNPRRGQFRRHGNRNNFLR